MSEQKSIDINLVKLVDLGTNILKQTLITPPKDKAKPLFKDIKAGKSVQLGSLTVAKQLDMPLKLTLDYSEFRGPGFNFDAFKVALGAMVKALENYLHNKKELNILTSETGTTLVHVPGLVQIEQQINVLVMAFETNKADQITLQLMFIDPEQYSALKST